jgi:hypothetical protein
MGERVLTEGFFITLGEPQCPIPTPVRPEV